MPVLNTIAIATHKGGVGKTTSAINLAFALARLDHHVLLVDLDPQAHATRSLGIERSYDEPSIADCLTRRDRAPSEALVVTNVRPNLDLLPSSIRLAARAEQMVTMIRRETILKEALAPLTRYYDFIVIDTAPGLGVLMANAIEAADRLIIPVDCGARSIDGLADFIDLVHELRGPTFRRWRILRTMVNKRASKTEIDMAERLAPYSRRMLSTVIHRSEIANRSHFKQGTVFEFDPRSAAAREYATLAQEVRAYAEGELAEMVEPMVVNG